MTTKGKLPKGLCWRGNVIYVDIVYEGDRYRRSTGTRNPKRAQRFLNDYLKKIKRQETQSNKKINYNLFDTESLIKFTYDRYWVGQADGENSRVRVTKIMKMLRCSVADITPLTIDKLIIRLKRQGFSASTINSYLSNLHVLMATANRQGVIPEAFDFPRLKTHSRIRVWSPEEVRDAVYYFQRISKRPTALSQAIDGSMVDLIFVLLDTGMRVGEVLNMRYKKNIDFHNDCIHLFEDITKTSKARSLRMAPRVREILESRRSDYPRHPFPYDRSILSKRIRQMTDYYEYEKSSLRLHDLRHTLATRMVRKGVSLYVVSKILGHYDIRTTEMYAHLLPLDVDSGFNIILEDEYSKDGLNQMETVGQ